MIIVHGTFPVKSERRDEALQLMRRMAIASRAEVGCISYEFYIALSDPNTLLLFQEWDSVDSLQGHFDTEHMEEFLRELPEVLNGEVTTRRYEVRSTSELSEDHEAEPDYTPRYQSRDKIIH